MIQVDISGAWGEISLPDMLELERAVFDAHEDSREAMANHFPEIDPGRILMLAQQMENISDTVVVLSDLGVLPWPGCAAFLGCRGEVQLLTAGDSFSVADWNRLLKHLESKDFSVVVLAEGALSPACAVTFRNLRWMLERRYGTQGAGLRIFTAAQADTALNRAAEKEGWSQMTAAEGRMLTAVLCGLNLNELLAGIKAAKAELELRSFDNPVWLYSVIRCLMYRRGKAVEEIGILEAGQAGLLGLWADCGGSLPVAVVHPGHGSIPDSRTRFETLLSFDLPDRGPSTAADIQDADGFTGLKGQYLGTLQEAFRRELLTAHTDGGVTVLCMDCGKANTENLGILWYFLSLTGEICRRILGQIPDNTEPAPDFSENMFASLGITRSEI